MAETYVAIIRKAEDTCFGVEFPDLDGCISAGETLHEAVENASEALALHLEGLAEDGVGPPKPDTVRGVLRTACKAAWSDGRFGANFKLELFEDAWSDVVAIIDIAPKARGK